MNDRNGLTLHDGDRVRVQTAPDGPVSYGTVDDATGTRAKELRAVLVRFDNGTAQYMGGEHLSVHLCGKEE